MKFLKTSWIAKFTKIYKLNREIKSRCLWKYKKKMDEKCTSWTIITHPTCSASTWSVRVSTCAWFTVIGTRPGAVCAKISFFTS